MSSRSAGSRIETGLALFAVCCLALAAAEIGARLALALRSAVKPPSAPADGRASAAPYADAAYDAARLFREDGAADEQMYVPYVVWHRRPFAGELVNVDSRGERVTHFVSDAPGALRVWLLGGSTIWGMGAPDAETIPSQLARILNEEWRVPARVRNLGEIGFVSSQELVALVRELQAGRRPDAVVFYDGVNDAPAAALWPDVPGGHMNLSQIRGRFEAREAPWRAVGRQSGLWRLALVLRRWLGLPDRGATPPYDVPPDAAATEQRAEQAARIWLENERLAAALARRFDFRHVFVLQPSLLVGAKRHDPSERALLASEAENPAKRAGMDVYAGMRERVRGQLARPGAPGDVVDLSDAFAEVEEPLYYDYVHMSGRGNLRIARELAALLRARLCAAPPRRLAAPVAGSLAAACAGVPAG